jgi:uncharacterized membrane protein YbhN (UPF0104 family)
MLFTLLSWIVLYLEYWLALHFLDLSLTLPQVVGVLTAARLAFLTPLPGGLGALVSSQILAISAMGYSIEDGASVAIIIRARDLLFGGLGLYLVGRLIRSDR